MWTSPFLVMVFNLLCLTGLTRLSNAYLCATEDPYVLHLTELTRLSNKRRAAQELKQFCTLLN